MPARELRIRPCLVYIHSDATALQFVLEPLYKIYSTVVGEHHKAVAAMLDEFGVHIKPSQYSLNVKPLLKLICTKVGLNHKP